MKTIAYRRYGSPEVITLEDAPTPVITDDQILVKVCAASVNPLDYRLMRGEPFLVRMQNGWRRPRRVSMGVDLAGRVEAVGRNVARFQTGDEIYGTGQGAFGEYVAAFGRSMALKPRNMTFEQAAAVPVAAITALQTLRDHGKLRSGQSVLINGAAGGVGTFMVQLARYFGGEITGVCSARNLELVRALGAAQVIDYTGEDFTRCGKRFDLVIDNVGNRSLTAMRRVIAPRGTFVQVGAPHGHIAPLLTMAAPMFVSLFSGFHAQMMLARITPPDLLFLKDLMEQGAVSPVIDRTYSLAETPEAIRYVESGHARAKVVIRIG